jgi:hypothetical protein
MVEIRQNRQVVRAASPLYSWEWDGATDEMALYDAKDRLIARGHHRPLILTARQRIGPPAEERTIEVRGDRVSISYRDVDTHSRLVVDWIFKADFISLEPLKYTAATREIIKVVYFPQAGADSYKPSLYSRYAVVPGLCMSTNVSPVVDLHSRLCVTAALGSGAMRGPGLTQQWGLPAHYFCTFNTADRWNAIGANRLQSSAACWGLAGLPKGDFRLEIRDLALSPVLNLRGDLWKGAAAPESRQLGCAFLIAFGDHYLEAIRSYYKILQREMIIPSGREALPERKSQILLSPQYNTWGAQSAKASKPGELTEETVRQLFSGLLRSGMKARTFVIDDKWEGRYGELRHDPLRFPNFQSLLDEIRARGFHIGLWAAFLRCEEPSALGLDESNLLQTPQGGPLWLEHGASRYGIFDVTQPAVQQALRERAKGFIRDYRPDLVKFDFGYELPSLDAAAPADMNWAGERLLQKGLEVVLGAMKEENPDLVVMYYGLSPLLAAYYDLHSIDDLVYCGGDYDLEANRRIFFSCLCGELGMPTLGSSGYDWESAIDIWFDAAASGSLGSLGCFEGDENGDLPREEWIAKFNGLNAVVRKGTVFQTCPVDESRRGGLRSGFSPSWARIENAETVLLALRTRRFDGKPARRMYKDILQTDARLVAASLTEAGIADAPHLGLVPFEDGTCTIKHNHPWRSARIIEHYLGGRKQETRVPCPPGSIRLALFQSRDARPLEWMEIIFEKDEPC